MKAKLIVEGKEFDIDILNPELEKLVKPPKETGYERAEEEQKYWIPLADGTVSWHIDYPGYLSNSVYSVANYYSDETVAENNARADTLMRRLRRFAVEYREKELDWRNFTQPKYFIRYNHTDKTFSVDFWCNTQSLESVYFDTPKVAQLAIDTFHDELIWYFTEYKDSL